MLKLILLQPELRLRVIRRLQEMLGWSQKPLLISVLFFTNQQLPLNLG